MILELISYAGLLFLSFLLVRAIIFSKCSKLPPGPLALPIIGHLHLLGPYMHHSFHKLSSRYGPLISIRIGSLQCVVASTPEMAKELLKTNDLAFSTRNHTAAIDHLTYNSSFAFAPYGPYWKFIRRLSTIELLGSRTLGQFLPIRAKEVHHLVKFLHDKSKVGESVNISEECMKLTNNVISQMMFSIRCSGTDGDDAGALAREVTEIFGEFNISDIIWFLKNCDLQGFRKRFMDLHRRYDSLIEKIITNREEVRKEKKTNGSRTSELGDEEVKDFLDIMLDVLENENENSEEQFTRDHIKALVLDFLTAATDTTAMSIEWALAELINHPEALEKARKEIDEVVGRSRLVEESDCPNLLYIQAVVKETFRVHPPIPMINRKSIEECKIGKYTIPEGTLLFVNLWSMGRDPNVWKNPLEFQPERFLQSDQESAIDVKGLHYQLLPFGTGRRGCPGLNLAMLEVRTTLAAMIQCFNWTVVHQEGVGKPADNTVDMTERPGLSAPRLHHLLCIPTVRCDPLILEI